MKWIVGLSLLAIGMGWAAIATIPAAAVTIDDTSLKFLPPETQGIAFIDVAALRSAALVQDVLKQGDLPYPRGWVNRGFTDFMAATGFDPEKDLDKVTIGKIGVRDALVVAQGRIDKFRLEQFFRDKGREPEAYLGQTLYHDGDGAFLVLNDLLLMGQVEAVKKGIDQMQLPGSRPLRSDLVAAIQTIEAGNQVWGVGDFSATDLGAIGVRRSNPAVQLLKSLNGGTYQMRIDTGVHVRGTGNFSDQESARNISDLAKGALALAKLRVSQQQPAVLGVLDGIDIRSSGTTVVVTIEESGDLLLRLQKLRPAPGNGN